MGYSRIFTEDESTVAEDSPTYEFAGFEVVASEKVALTPPDVTR
jgi:hypothetical protein